MFVRADNIKMCEEVRNGHDNAAVLFVCTLLGYAWFIKSQLVLNYAF